MVRVAKGWQRKVLQTEVDYGELDGERLASEQACFLTYYAEVKWNIMCCPHGALWGLRFKSCSFNCSPWPESGSL